MAIRLFTASEIAHMYGRSERTFYRHLKEKHFKREQQGRFYTKSDVIKISKLLHFVIDKKVLK